MRKRDNTPEVMRQWLDMVPLVTDPPTADAVFAVRCILGCELVVAVENDEPVLAESLRNCIMLLTGEPAPNLAYPDAADEPVLAGTHEPGCIVCGGSGLRCCEFGASR
jgi:hypothetical protein